MINQNSKLEKLCLNGKDIQRITGKGKNYSTYVNKAIRSKYKKYYAEHCGTFGTTQVSVFHFIEFLGITSEQFKMLNS